MLFKVDKGEGCGYKVLVHKSLTVYHREKHQLPFKISSTCEFVTYLIEIPLNFNQNDNLIKQM